MSNEEKNKNEAEELADKLLFNKKSVWEDIESSEEKEIFQLAEDYKLFLDAAKTEREAVAVIAERVSRNGYVDIRRAASKDRRLFLNYGDTAAALAFIGDPGSFRKGFLINGAHIDSPRLDLKQSPLFEAEDMAYMKTHYYGGIKKYQWVARPLALHGTIVTEEGDKINVNIGEDPDDPVFVINDLLPHLAAEQNKKTAPRIIEGEQLNIIVGTIPYKFKPEKKAIKLNILYLLNQKYGIIEQDLVSAELQLVPAGKARDAGFDKSLVGAYGQDDRVCAYLGMRALLEMGKDNSNKNLIMVFFDKEEIGSVGAGGAESNLMERIIKDIIKHFQTPDYLTMIESLENSKFLSADVNAGIDPEWKSVHEPMNAAKIGRGVCLTKYTGVRGKVGANDAPAELAAEIRKAFNLEKVLWQNAELGKVDQGGGGTVAKYLARLGMSVIDCGPALLSMHSPFEIASKADIHHTLKAYKAFYKHL